MADEEVFDNLWVTLGYLAGDYNTSFAPGKVLAGRYHQANARELMRVFDIRMRSNPDTLTTATPNEEEN